jgi:hypothetical protein
MRKRRKLTPSTTCGCPPPEFITLFWLAPNPVVGVLATSSMSFIMDLRRATWTSPNILGSCSIERKY